MNELITQFRFSLDELDSASSAKLLEPSETLSSGLRHYFLANSLRITPSVTPRLARIVHDVSEALFFDREIEAFVFSSSEPQAFCAPCEEGAPFTLMISSGLVQLLSDDELRFVCQA